MKPAITAFPICDRINIRRSLFCLFLCLGVFCQLGYAQGQGASGGGSGGGIGGLYGFKYIIFPSKEAVPNKAGPRTKAAIRHFFSTLFLGRGGARIRPDTINIATQKGKAAVFALSTLIDNNATKALVKKIDSLRALTQLLVARKPSDTLNYAEDLMREQLNNYFLQLRDTIASTKDSLVFFKFSYGIDSIYYNINPPPVQKNSIDSSSSFQLRECCGVLRDSMVTVVIYKKTLVMESGQPKLVTKSLTSFLLADASDGNRFHGKLKIYISALSKQTDSVTFKIWHSLRIQRIRPHPLGLTTDSAYRLDFSFVSPWNETTGSHRKMVLPFRTKYLIPVNLPFLYDFNTKSVSATFLNAGLAYGWAWGRTKFYEYTQMPPRNAYFGGGPLFNLSSTLTASSSSSTTPPTTFAKLLLGGHVGYSTGSLQILLAGGWYYDVGGKQGIAIHSKPVIAFGFGLSLFNFAVPSSTGQGGGGGH